ncbi:Transposon TX1 uncharacterized 149 kDa protein [Vitis vinifera]|uniref:Transposon TX1 uncharacterized 149 kDa protein n=1 Tax=Vitis vinifera TaxID=29760 RepID=A0A438EBI2_VITVI|nr:Transposon TX1 uncharacterized 149 kDa protein [Vitis vinifera]
MLSYISSESVTPDIQEIQNEGYYLQLGAKDALLNALLLAAKRFSSGPPQLLTQICLALSALIIRSTEHRKPIEQLFYSLQNLQSQDDSNIAVLEMLTVLPEEIVENQNIDCNISSDRRCQYGQEVRAGCFAEIPPGLLPGHPLLNFVYNSLQVSSTFDLAIEVLVELVGRHEESNDVGPGMDDKGCWDMVEFNKDPNLVRGVEWNTERTEFQEARREKEDRWEESSLAKFSHFLGFSTEGLEKEILNFLVKIRKRREKIHSKELMEKSKFERELKRLECSVNYEKGGKQRSLLQGKGDQLAETKIQPMSEGVVRSLGSGRFLDWRALDTDGAAGGLLICWDKRSMEVVDWEEGQYSLSCRFKNVEDGAVWVFTGVYGPFTKEAREGLWEELGAVRGIWDEPWAGRPPLARGSVYLEWGPEQPVLGKAGQYHFPILLEGGGLRRGPSPFRFENMWLKVEGFLDLIRSWWREIEVRGTASYRLAAKTKELKQKLKVWNREVFGNLEGNKRAALQQVDYWDGVESERSLSLEETELKKEAKESYKKWVMLEESHWRQLSREVWLKEGDKNTRFFHRMANAHRNNNTLDKVKIDGVWLEEDQEVREGIANAFHQRLSEDMGWKADIEGIQLDRISQHEAESLEIPFSENEIHSALMEMSGDKAPGPDGFTMAFWQSSWDFVKEEILEMFKEFHEQGSFLKSLNNTFLVLIPKKGGADDLGDFRPISLLGGLYKLMAKVLANRLKRVLNKVVALLRMHL